MAQSLAKRRRIYRANREKILEKHRAYYIANREKCLARDKRRRDAKREMVMSKPKKIRLYTERKPHERAADPTPEQIEFMKMKIREENLYAGKL